MPLLQERIKVLKEVGGVLCEVSSMISISVEADRPTYSTSTAPSPTCWSAPSTLLSLSSIWSSPTSLATTTAPSTRPPPPPH